MVEVFLPGVVCSTTWSLAPMNCGQRQVAWPLGIENVGLEPTRNYFATPEGVAFYGVASLDANAGARWLVADRSGSLTMIGDARESIVTTERASDVVAIRPGCGTETYAVVAGTADGRDSLRLMRLDDRRLTVVAPPLLLAGTVTALWALPNASTALLVTRDESAGRYDAFRVDVSCGR
jgi:hypothetical protein